MTLALLILAIILTVAVLALVGLVLSESQRSQEIAEAKFEAWRRQRGQEVYEEAKRDAYQRILQDSQYHTIAEKVLVWYHAQGYNSADVRYLGSPVDYVIFDGLSSPASQQIKVIFLEVKTGQSQLTERQQIVKEAIESGRVEWQTVRIPSVI